MDNEEKRILDQIPKAELPRFRARTISAVLNKLIMERGYASEQSNRLLSEEWGRAVGSPLNEQTRVGKIRNGVLQIFVSNQIVLSELEFMKTKIHSHLQRTLPDFGIKKIRFYVSN